jgi:hypothetical protein
MLAFERVVRLFSRILFFHRPVKKCGTALIHLQKFLVCEMESGFDPLKLKVRENPAWVALGGEIPSLTIPFQLLKRY